MHESHLGNVAKRERVRREIRQRCDQLAPLPEVVVETLEMLRKPDTEPAALERSLHRDQVLVAKILGLVNSPLYGLRRPVQGVRDAVVVLGFRGLRSLLLASGATAYLERDYRCYGHGERGLLEHSVAVATGCRALAEHTGQGAEAVDNLFIAGLLHDIGKMLVAPYLAQKLVAPPGSERSVVELERQAVGLDHMEAGHLIATRWNLGEDAQQLLGLHHEDRGTEALRVRLATLHLADDLAHELQLGYEPGHAPKPRYRAEDFEALQLDPEGWQQLRPELAEALARAVATLDDL